MGFWHLQRQAHRKNTIIYTKSLLELSEKGFIHLHLWSLRFVYLKISNFPPQQLQFTMYTKTSREIDKNVISFVQKGEAKSRKEGKDTTNALASLGTGDIDKNNIKNV